MISEETNAVGQVAESARELSDFELAALISDLGSLLAARMVVAQRTVVEHEAGAD